MFQLLPGPSHEPVIRQNENRVIKEVGQFKTVERDSNIYLNGPCEFLSMSMQTRKLDAKVRPQPRKKTEKKKVRRLPGSKVTQIPLEMDSIVIAAAAWANCMAWAATDAAIFAARVATEVVEKVKPSEVHAPLQRQRFFQTVSLQPKENAPVGNRATVPTVRIGQQLFDSNARTLQQSQKQRRYQSRPKCRLLPCPNQQLTVERHLSPVAKRLLVEATALKENTAM
jgi:hypothetical protein